MYGSSGKFGRGGASGGRGGGKRTNPLTSSFHSTPPTHRSSSATPNNRLSSGSASHRSRSATPASMASSAPSSTEETFSVETRNPLDFAMIIRLAPDLVEEIKRVEADGGTARIKFDPNANNTSGNVIHVGNKDFRFTWSREMGDLCDIYEERQSGEDGNGLLVESGCAWRKLNVQRVLDESTKNHVKRRSEEAEKKLKSRKAIILDPKNPSMKNQVKALAAAEATQWRKPFKQKEPELKKRKIETPPVNSGPPKSVYKSGLSSSTPSKGRPSASPLPSPPEIAGASSSPFGTRTPAKGPTSVEDVMIQGATQKSVASSEKDTFNRAGSARERQVDRGNKSVDLQSMLISILKENPKGLNMKSLEKAVGDTIPNSAGKIDPILKKIATFQAPGRYVLKPGIELEDVKKPLSEGGSSPKDNRYQAPAPADKHHNILTPLGSDKVATEVAKQAELNSNIGEELDPLEDVDILFDSPPQVDDKKIPERSEGHAGSSSESGSDSESESSDSGSDSGSHSRSRSKSGSSSDSDSDASSNSKQGSDEDVDIISDDEKEPNNQMQASAVGVPISPVPWISEDGPLQNGNDKQDDNESDIVEIEKDLSDDDQGMGVSASHLSSSKEIEKPTHDVRISSPDLQEMQGSQVYRESLLGERENFTKDGSKLEQENKSERTGKGKSKRSGESKHLINKSEHTKRQKLGSLPQPQLSEGRDGLLSESSPYRVIEEPGNSHANRALNKTSKDADYPGVQKDIDQGHPGKSVLEESLGRRPVETSSSVKALGVAEKPSTASESFGRGIKLPERNHHLNESLHVQKDKVPKGGPGEELYTKEKKVPRNSKESSFGDKRSTPLDSYYNGTHGDADGNIREAGEVSEMLQMGYPPKNDNRTGTGRPSSMNGRSKILHREHSDLELGEFREPSPEEILGVKKDFARKGSFKLSENKPSTSGFSNSDLSKGRSTGMVESGKPSSPHPRAGVSSNPESSFKKRSPEHHAEDSTRPYSRAVQNQPLGSQHMSRTDHELGTQKQVDGNSKKASAVAQQQLVNVRGPLIHPTKEVKTHKSSILSDLNDIQKDTSLTGSDDGGLKRRESSSDENSCSYSKYEKEDPEFRGPIRDFTQYKESVQEYREKYDSYCSLNKALESYRNEFQKLGKDIEVAKARDREKYYHLLGQLKESYRQCGTRHKRLKKIFVVLHEELKHLKQMIKDYALSYSKD